MVKRQTSKKIFKCISDLFIINNQLNITLFSTAFPDNIPRKLLILKDSQHFVEKINSQKQYS